MAIERKALGLVPNTKKTKEMPTAYKALQNMHGCPDLSVMQTTYKALQNMYGCPDLSRPGLSIHNRST